MLGIIRGNRCASSFVFFATRATGIPPPGIEILGQFDSSRVPWKLTGSLLSMVVAGHASLWPKLFTINGLQAVNHG